MGVDWKNLVTELLTVIAGRLDGLADFIRFSAVCKAWNSAASEAEAPWLSSSRDHPHPLLLLAEDIGADLSRVTYNIFNDEASSCSFDGNCYSTTNIIRGLYSLATQKIYDLDLPEARDKLILGTNKGWLVTFGRDLQVNLLHPLFRDQILLPSMPSVPSAYENDDHFPRACTMFISKVVLSSELPRKSALRDQGSSHPPVIMVIYEQRQKLAFSRLGDKSWTCLELDSPYWGIEDIVYHKGKFHAISFRGTIFLCDTDNNDKKERQHRGEVLTSIPVEKNDLDQCYMVESLSGSHIWLVFRIREGICYREVSPIVPGQFKYRTIDFVVLKLEVHYYNNHDVPSCTWEEEVKDLGNEALFIGRASSISVASSEHIKSNSIYFTDDSEYHYHDGCGHDMGIFNLETKKIQPHYQGMSIHTFSPPLWYI